MSPEVERAWGDLTPEEQATVITVDQVQIKREQVMARAKKIGHCVCNRTKPCPCDILLKKNVCICAGESLDDAPAEVENVT
jgi:hypothetical protein